MSVTAISVGITTRNRPDSLRRSVASVAVLGDLVAEVLIGDDRSDVPAGGQLAGHVPIEIEPLLSVMAPPAQRGYIAARNAMVAAARSPYVLLLDDDTRVLDRESVAAALDVMARDARVGAVAFAQAEADGSPWPAALQPSAAQYACYVPSFIGFAHLVRRDVFLQLGGYRGSFEFYGEEKEYCLRLLDAGFDVVYLPESRIAHLPDGAGREARRYLRYVSRNDCLGAIYNDPWWRLGWVLPARLALYLRMRRRWRIDDAGGFIWLMREVARALPEARRLRRPLRRAAFRRWRALRRHAPPYAARSPGA